MIHSVLSESITATQFPANIHHAIPKAKFCRLVQNSSLNQPLAWMSKPARLCCLHMHKELYKPILRWVPKAMSCPSKALSLQSQHAQALVQGVLSRSRHCGNMNKPLNTLQLCWVTARLSELALTVFCHQNRKLSYLVLLFWHGIPADFTLAGREMRT